MRHLLVTVLAATAAAADPTPAEVAQAAIARNEAAVAAANHPDVRAEHSATFAFTVVDQNRRPVVGVAVPVTLFRIDRTVPKDRWQPGQLPPEECQRSAPVTDDHGVVRLEVPRFLELIAGFDRLNEPWPRGFMVMDDPDSLWSTDDHGPDDGPADHHTFTLYRLAGEPLVRLTPSMVPADGDNHGMDLLAQPPPPHAPISATDADQADLLVRAWHEPVKHLVGYEIPTIAPGKWWIEITCQHGGIIPCTDALPFHAPATGYVRTLRWEMDPTDPSFRGGPWCGVYWRRAGTPVRYGYLAVHAHWFRTPEVSVSGWLNPAGSPVLERPFTPYSDDDRQATWITDITGAQRAAWSAEPRDAGSASATGALTVPLPVLAP
jgi:hypothetical protein